MFYRETLIAHFHLLISEKARDCLPRIYQEFAQDFLTIYEKLFGKVFIFCKIAFIMYSNFRKFLNNFLERLS